jgi:hypothetical protein
MKNHDTAGNIIAFQKRGAKTGATKKVNLPTRHGAIMLFNKAKMRLLDVNSWQALCGTGSAEFQLTDEHGKPLNTIVADKGNLIRISLPAPGNASGSGYDWVRIEEFEHHKELLKDEESYGFRVRPVENPIGNSEASAHFYTKQSTSTFLIVRRANKVIAMERGRNEVPNVSSVSMLNKIRNVVVAVLAMLGLAKPQWQRLVNGFLAEG